MDLTLEIDTENQQQIKLKQIHYTIKASTSKEYSQLLYFLNTIIHVICTKKPEANKNLAGKTCSTLIFYGT